MIKYLRAILFFIPILFLQIFAIPFIAFDVISPNLILILLVYFTIQNGQIYGSILGFIFGLFFDLFSGGIIGSSMFAFTSAGFVTGYFYNPNKTESNFSSINFTLIVFVSASVYAFLFSILGPEKFDFDLMKIIFERSILPAFYTAVISLIFIVLSPKRSFQND